MTNKTTHYQFILDKSGSMISSIDATIEGFNNQLNMLKSLQEEFSDQKFYFSLTTFNQEIELDFSDSDVSKAPCLTKTNYVPSGSTSLLDAIGTSIGRLEEKHNDAIEANEASVVCVILTDGHENSSRNFSFDSIKKTIGRLEETGKWSFTFLGAGINAWAVSDALGIARTSSVAFDKQDMSEFICGLAGSMRTYVADKSEGRIRKDFLDSVD